MNSHMRRLLPWMFPVVLVGACIWSVLGATAATQTSVGEIQDVQGHGWGISELGEKYDKLGGDLLVMDEVVATDVNSAMTMRFIDNTTMTLGPEAEITIDEMVYNPEDGDNDAVTFRLGKGSFYFVSGLVAKNKVTIITPTATIGIRGTELIIDVDEGGATAVGVAKGHAFIRSNNGGRAVEVEVGNTARTNKNGVVGKPFPGIDLTGDEEVDRKIPGVSEWLDEDDGELDDDETKKDKRARNEGPGGGDDRYGDEDDTVYGHKKRYGQEKGDDGDRVASAEGKKDHDRESSDRDSSDRESSDRESNDRESNDRESSDRESSDRESNDSDSQESDSDDSDDNEG
ncbi:MAG TPA: FecR domain-containing protein [Magnetovibrio sp.]